MGETSTGRQGKKYRVESKGARKATPKPPLVKASRMPWDAVAAKNAKKARQRDPPMTQNDDSARSAAKASECVMPRWPHGAPYSTP